MAMVIYCYVYKRTTPDNTNLYIAQRLWTAIFHFSLAFLNSMDILKFIARESPNLEKGELKKNHLS